MSNAKGAVIDKDQCPHTYQGLEGWLFAAPAEPWATLLLAHGAGAGMDSEFLEQLVAQLLGEGLAVWRFEFPYMAARRTDGRRRPPNPQAQLLDSWRERVADARLRSTGPLVLAGKSMGGRMASLLADELALPVVCFGYPFHPSGKPDKLRIAHLQALRMPALIVQGERDPFGRREEVSGYALSASVRLHWLVDADHDFKALRRSALDQAALIREAARQTAAFVRQQLSD